jgi:hypothetical protein
MAEESAVYTKEKNMTSSVSRKIVEYKMEFVWVLVKNEHVLSLLA